MSNLVRRLRAECPYTGVHPENCVKCRAADEIERLRAEIAANDAAKDAKIARLQKALREIDDKMIACEVLSDETRALLAEGRDSDKVAADALKGET